MMEYGVKDVSFCNIGFDSLKKRKKEEEEKGK